MMYLELLLALLAFSVCEGQSDMRYWHRSEMKNPQVDIDACGRYRKSMICDPDNILDEEDADQLDKLIDKVTNTTECPCSEFYCNLDRRGYHIAIALVNHMRWDDMEDDNDNDNKLDGGELAERNLLEAEKFAYTLQQNWEIGQCNEEVIIFYSVYDNVLYTVTGKEAKLKLNNRVIGEISINHRAHFSPESDVFTGLRKLIIDFHDVFNGDYKERQLGVVEPQNPQAVVGAAASHIGLSAVSVGALALAALLL